MCENAECRRNSLAMRRFLERLRPAVAKCRAYLASSDGERPNREVRSWLFHHWCDFLRGSSLFGSVIVTYWLTQLSDSLADFEAGCACDPIAPGSAIGANDATALEPR